MKTKPFNLEEALAGAKVVTRDGQEVSQLTFFKNVNTFPVFAVIDGEIEQFNIDGKFLPYVNDISKEDLFLEVEVNKIYINVYLHEKNGLFVSPLSFKDRKTAIVNNNHLEGANSKYLKTIEITEEP